MSVGRTFTPSSQQQCISIPIVHDHVHEDTECFRVGLSSSLPHVNIDPATATVYIINRNSKFIIIQCTDTIRKPVLKRTESVSMLLFTSVQTCLGVTIGLEQTHHQVQENAGNVSVCVRVLQPVDERTSLSGSFRVGIRTNQNMDTNGANFF